MEATYIIIGGGVAGTTAAETIRRKDPHGSIAIVSDEPHRLYSRVLLSKANLFLGKISFDSLWLRDESWYEKNSISLLKGVRALSLDTRKSSILLENGTSLHYKKLLLATGGHARTYSASPPETGKVFYLHTIDDAKAISQKLLSAKKAVIFGGGFIAFEACEMLHKAAINTTLLLPYARIWEKVFDEVGSASIESQLKQNSVKILRNAKIQAVTEKSGKMVIRLSDDKTVSCDMLVIGIGLEYDKTLLQNTDIAFNSGILVNEYLETSVPDIFAAGDIAEFNDICIHERHMLGNWVNAQMQGRCAGENMASSVAALKEKKPFRFVSSYTTEGFGMKMAFVGTIRSDGDYRSIVRKIDSPFSYTRLVIKNNKIIGAVFINRSQKLGTLSRAIEQGLDIDSVEKDLL